jgi:hypothetical protein
MIYSKQNLRLAEAWSYINQGVAKGMWLKEEFEGLNDDDIVKVVERMTSYEKQWRMNYGN